MSTTIMKRMRRGKVTHESAGGSVVCGGRRDAWMQVAAKERRVVQHDCIWQSSVAEQGGGCMRVLALGLGMRAVLQAQVRAWVRKKVVVEWLARGGGERQSVCCKVGCV